jgi:hypothetical protein
MTLPDNMPGIAMSAPYWARPVTFGTPSGRIGRVPTHLNRFGEMSFIAVSVVALHGLLSAYRLAARAQKQNRSKTVSPRLRPRGLSTARRHLSDKIGSYHRRLIRELSCIFCHDIRGRIWASEVCQKFPVTFSFVALSN